MRRIAPSEIMAFTIDPPLRGINLGNALEAPAEGAWGVTLQEEYFSLIKEAGFTAVRIPIRWPAHALPKAPYTISPTFFDRVDWAVEHALDQGLITIINIHHYDEFVNDPPAEYERFLALWRQIAEHYQEYDADLWFEILNEPHGRLDGALWNRYAREALAVIRETNPSRPVVIGPGDWNGIGALGRLELPPEDRRLVVTFHYYAPFEFTHQGAEWVPTSQRWLGTTWEGTPAQQEAVRRDLDKALVWAQKEGRPLLMGEFGAYSKADMASRVQWTAFVAREAELRGISWAYWEFCAGFGAYDPQSGTWREPILKALIPSP